MPPKKKTTSAAVTGGPKPIRRGRKYGAKKSSKVCKGADIESTNTKEVKPVKRGLKRKLIQIDLGLELEHSNEDATPAKTRMKRKLIEKNIEFNNDIVVSHTTNDSKNVEVSISSNKPVAKKRRITRNIETKSMVTRNNKKCAKVGTRGKGNLISKSLTLNSKVIPKDLKIIRTIVNDYVPDAPENDEYTAITKTNSSTQSVDVRGDGCSNKIPVIILEKLNTNYNSNYVTSKKSDKTQDVLPMGSPCHESFSDKLCFLDNYKSILDDFTGYSCENNVDLSRKTLHVSVQTQELKSVICGGVFPTNASSSDNDSISVKADEDKCSKPHEQVTKDQVIKTGIRAESDYVSPCRLINVDDDDDDDIISLFAESLSGFETNPKMSDACNLDKCELDNTKFKIPKPVPPKPCIAVCERQKADSTSVGLLEVSKSKVETSSAVHIKPENKVMKNVATKVVRCRIFSPDLLGLHSPVTLVKSAVFKGICIFNIIKNCKKTNCNFPHTIPSATFVNEKLLELNQDQFHQECLMVCKKAELLRLYGLLYIQEAIRRNNNSIVIEIMLSFLIKQYNQEEKPLVTEVVERTLLYLNDVSLSEIIDLLSLEIKSGVQMCDKFLEVLGQTQNFSRFKAVFVKLTVLMCRQKRTFNSDVVAQILERVCILPYSFDLARALIDLMKRTDAGVFYNPMIEIFEKKLLKCDKQLLLEFIRIKDEALSSNHYARPTDNHDRLWNVGDNSMRYSPDTTNKDIPERHETHMDLSKADRESQQSTPRRSLGPRPHINWGGPAAMNQSPKSPYRPLVPINYSMSPTLRNLRPHQMNPRQRRPGANWVEPPRPHFPLQNILRGKSKGW